MKTRFSSLLLTLPICTAAASVPVAPGSDIWAAELQVSAQDLRVGEPRNLTLRRGYDNQPAFVSASSFLFASMDEDGATDVWRYEFGGDVETLLQTPESEYSPTPAPGGAVSVVRVAGDGVQQLAMLQPGGERYEVLFPMLERVGYHAWVDDEHVALFMVDDPPELHVANRRSGQVVVFAKSIGRSLQPVPGGKGAIAFIEPGPDGGPWIKRLDPANRRIEALAPALEGSEDFAFLPDGRLLMARDRSLFLWDGEAWRSIASFASLPGGISRLAVAPDASRLLLVVDEGNGG